MRILIILMKLFYIFMIRIKIGFIISLSISASPAFLVKYKNVDISLFNCPYKLISNGNFKFFPL